MGFTFSKTNLGKSVSKQNGDFQNYVKMLTVFEQVVENAVGIEVHKERYQNEHSNVDKVFVLTSAFENDTGILPILLEVKTFTDGNGSALYVAINLSEIGRSHIVGYTHSSKTEKPYPLVASFIKIADIFENVNLKDGQFLKYIPDGFLSEEQKAAKKIALEEQDKYVRKKNISRYLKE